ncbi:hypothetical protein B566_EDAN011191 [Ephemera danica]|nr:hypothetical protein B566_EDAN011191 [Ephemera danica]
MCVAGWCLSDHVTLGLDGPQLTLYRLMSEARQRSNSKAALLSRQDASSSADDSNNTSAAMPGEKQLNWSLVADRMWEDWQLPVLIVLLGAASVVLLTFLILLWLKNQMLPRSKSETATPGQWIFHPVAKGLLERRGSSASLTIDLHPSQENLAVVTPTKECSTQEFLLSAGNCYSRGQLRGCLRDIGALHSEFWDIPSNIPEKTELAGSGTKNRYRSILPNEHSRVRLPETEGDPLTGYINANYGPLPHTLHDFWSMVVSERASAIVMITKLREKGRAKCEAYLPSGPGLPMVVSDIRRGEETELSLRHFWFTDWPDHKTPEDAGPLVAMAKEACDSQSSGPVVVHCSAGIGRTGCFIALATGMRQGGMVQTAEQYEFLHRALCLYERSLPDSSSAGE